MSQCPQCGTAAVGDDQRFCAQCGTELVAGGAQQVPPPAPGPAPGPVSAVEPPPAYGHPPRVTGPLFADDAPPTVATPPAAPTPVHAQPPVPGPRPAAYDDGSGRRRTTILLLVVAAVLAALLGAGGVVLLLGSEDESPSDTTVDDRRDDVDTTPDTGATPTTTSTTPTTSSSETGATEQQAVQCWDGESVASLDSCSPPSGVEGMAWVFPSSTGSSCSAEPGVQRLTEADCTPTVAGETVRMHYSEWRSRTELESYYGGLTIGTLDPPDGRDDLAAREVVSRDPDVGYKVAIYYTSASGLWSVTVYAADEAQYLAALGELEIRPFGQLQGRPG
ncbi:zinc ribbon domain-containing protein [Nocardioides antri]|uniref:Zinc ribbon domain-containing protein n=1 Tax=Nocardioides antri TaxID=2607659 RepID=A0A5B1M611_9ACTN|nr:zinc ribbon domain-containing protein [Nocardioides antri]KAA1427559.1 hypothetical protein F0U47_08860 [Nocardioides antri]